MELTARGLGINEALFPTGRLGVDERYQWRPSGLVGSLEKLRDQIPD
jgi:hypothetical protein